jgi:putative transposase
MLVTRSHRIRLNPTTEQEQAFVRAAGVARFAYNWALADYKAAKARRERYDWNDAKKRFRQAIAAKFAWVREVTKCAPEEAIAELRQTIATYYKARAAGRKIGFPGFRSRHKRIGGFGVANDKFTLDGNHVRLPKIGRVNMAEPLRLQGKILSGRVVEDGGRWYLVVTVSMEKPASAAAGSVGIDFGLTNFAVLSDGTVYETQAGFRKGQRKLRALQRGLSRKRKGSKNRAKWKARVARHHTRIANQRRDYLHKVTSEIAAKYAAVSVEDLNLRGFCRTRLAKSFTDAAIGKAVRMLEYKCAVLQKVDRFFPSSRLCRFCGQVNNSLTLSDRSWLCACGAFHNRDLNAAINLDIEGNRLLAGCSYVGVTPVELAASTSDSGRTQAVG